MRKRISSIVVLLLVVIFTGCASKADLRNKVTELKEENDELSVEYNKYKNIEKLLEFYNTITTSTVNSLVLVESSSNITTTKVYANGLVVANDNYYYYVITDYNALKQVGTMSFKVRDTGATVYSASLYGSVDTETGLVLLKVNAGRQTNIQMKAVYLGESTSTYGYLSSINQLNKVQIYDELKTSTYTYNGTSYVTYLVDDAQNGSILVNDSNKAFGIYLSNLNSFASSNLIKAIVLQTYSIKL